MHGLVSHGTTDGRYCCWQVGDHACENLGALVLEQCYKVIQKGTNIWAQHSYNLKQETIINIKYKNVIQ